VITLESPMHRLGDLTALVNDVECGTLDPLEVRVIDVVQHWVSTLEAEEWGDLDVAGFFFMLASRLLVLKLRLLLPAPLDDEPFTIAPHDLQILGRLGEQLAVLEERQQYLALCALEHDGPARHKVLGDADSLAALLRAAGDIIHALQKAGSHAVMGEFMSAEEARARVSALVARGPQTLHELLSAACGILEVLSYFLALLEIIRLGWCAIRVEDDVVWIMPMAEVGSCGP